MPVHVKQRQMPPALPSFGLMLRSLERGKQTPASSDKKDEPVRARDGWVDKEVFGGKVKDDQETPIINLPQGSDRGSRSWIRGRGHCGGLRA